MHLILLNFILLLLLLKPTLQATITIATSHLVLNPQRWAAQTCSNIVATKCCEPPDLNILGFGHGWFRATIVQFNQLPSVSLYLSVWRAQGTGYSCGGPTLGDVVSDGEPSLEYSDASGVGGARYTVWISDANKTVVATSPEVVYPDRIMYGGAIYTELNGEKGIFRSPVGQFIFGVPFSTSIFVFYAIEARRAF
jgi:hypothetical protein